MVPPDANSEAWALHDLKAVARCVHERFPAVVGLEDSALCDVILALEGASGQLVARLLARQPRWFRVSQLPADDVPAVDLVSGLVTEGWLEWSACRTDQISCFTVAELREKCRSLGLPRTGRRADLEDRLKEACVDLVDGVVRVRQRAGVRRLERICFQSSWKDRSWYFLERTNRVRSVDYLPTGGPGLFRNADHVALWDAVTRGDLGAEDASLLCSVARAQPLERWRAQVDPLRLLEDRVYEQARLLEQAGDAAGAGLLYRRMALSPGRQCSGGRQSTEPVRRAALCEAALGRSGQGARICAAWRSRASPVERLALDRTGRRLARAAGIAWRPGPPLRKARERQVPVPCALDADGHRVWTGGVPIEEAVLQVLGNCSVVGGENSVWRTLFGLLFFDLLWLPVPGMLPVEGLDAPLDYGTRHFASARAGLLAARLKDLSDGHGEAVMRAGLCHRGCSIRGVNWRFSDAELLAMVQALPGSLLGSVLERMAWEGQGSWSGLPDLLVLDGTGRSIEGAFPARLPEGPLFVEVKGPGDSLRDGQRIWIDRLLALGARVEVWRVEGRPMNLDRPAEFPCGSSSPEASCGAAPCLEKLAPESARPQPG